MKWSDLALLIGVHRVSGCSICSIPSTEDACKPSTDNWKATPCLKLLFSCIKSHTFFQLFFFLHVIHSETNLASEHTKGKATFCALFLFLENNKRRTFVNYSFFCTLPCILIAEQRKKEEKKVQQYSWIHKCVGNSCIISFIHHCTSCYFQS